MAQLRELRDKAQNYTFQTEVNRMMKLIINSLYRNKEVSVASCRAFPRFAEPNLPICKKFSSRYLKSTSRS